MQAPSAKRELPTFDEVALAAERIRGRVRRTPVIRDPGLDAACGCMIHGKCENLQRAGAFKFRGACHAVARLREQGIAGDVATHSSGNHGAALALAAQLDGRTAHVVMPDDSSRLKIDAVRRYGGAVHFCAPTHIARESGLAELVQRGYHPIPPYDDEDIIAGQGTACLELMEDLPDLDLVIAPVGGGGLISGTALAAARRGIAVLGAEPEGAADTAASLERGSRVTDFKPDTIADGLRAIVGIRNFAIIRSEVEAVLTVSDRSIRQAMELFWSHTRMLLEPSAAVVIAAIRSHPERFAGRKVGAILSGGNIDPAEWLRLVRPGPEHHDS